MALASPEVGAPSPAVPLPPQSLALLNSKGGAGKTSISANLAGVAGLRGWRVLLVDLDPQANIGEILGYNQRGETDHGEALMRAIVNRRSLDKPVLRNWRQNVDVVCGGDYLDALPAEIVLADQAEPGSAATLLRTALGPLAHGYDLMVIDCPPSVRSVLAQVAATVRFLVIPTRGTEMSNIGMRRVGEVYVEALRTTNPDLELLGVVLFDIAANSRGIRKSIRKALNKDFGGDAPIFDAFIRHGQHAPRDMEEYGLLAYEYEHLALSGDRRVSASKGSVIGLAQDYSELTVEILTKMNKALGAQS